MYEDDGISMDYETGAFVTTEYRLEQNGGRFVIGAAKDELSLIPERRSYTIRFYGVGKDAVEGARYDGKRNIATLELGPTPVTEETVIDLKDPAVPANNIREACYGIINRAQCPFSQKDALFRLIKSGKPLESSLSTLDAMQISSALRSAVSEMLLA